VRAIVVARVPIDRLALNAAIECLIAGERDAQEAARIVIEYGCKLKKSSPINREAYYGGGSSDGSSISGYTPEHGQITFKDERPGELKVTSFGIHKERVGHYRVWKRRKGVLCLHYFWGADIITRSSRGEDVAVYWLAYDPKSLASRYFAVECKKILFSWKFVGRHEIIKYYLQRFSGMGKLPMLTDIGWISFYDGRA